MVRFRVLVWRIASRPEIGVARAARGALAERDDERVATGGGTMADPH